MSAVRIVHLGTQVTTQLAAVSEDGEVIEQIQLPLKLQRLTMQDFMLAGKDALQVRAQFVAKYAPPEPTPINEPESPGSD